MTLVAQEFVSLGERETRDEGMTLAATLPAQALVAISGDLGSGKTALVRGICEYHGCENQVTSPTFTIVNEYEGSIRILHIDLYRFSTIQEMLEIGLDELLRADALVVVEWAERALPILPAPRVEIAARYGDEENIRLYTLQHFRPDMETILIAPVNLFGRPA